ncbi:MAG: hypothetical protein AB1650_08580 [Candidatus Omnitrophota bacterium]
MSSENIKLKKMNNQGWAAIILLLMAVALVLFLFSIYNSPSNNISQVSNEAPGFDFSKPNETSSSRGPVAVLESATRQIKKIEQHHLQRGDEIMQEIGEMYKY